MLPPDLPLPTKWHVASHQGRKGHRAKSTKTLSKSFWNFRDMKMGSYKSMGTLRMTHLALLPAARSCRDPVKARHRDCAEFIYLAFWCAERLSTTTSTITARSSSTCEVRAVDCNHPWVVPFPMHDCATQDWCSIFPASTRRPWPSSSPSLGPAASSGERW